MVSTELKTHQSRRRTNMMTSFPLSHSLKRVTKRSIARGRSQASPQLAEPRVSTGVAFYFNQFGSCRRCEGLAMDAPGATSPDESAVERSSTDTVLSRSSTDTIQETQDQSVQDSHSSSSSGDEEEDEEAGDEDDSDDDEEPRLKYAYLTKHLGSVYRNGDATSSFLVAGDKMVWTLPRRLDTES